MKLINEVKHPCAYPLQLEGVRVGTDSIRIDGLGGVISVDLGDDDPDGDALVDVLATLTRKPVRPTGSGEAPTSQ